jgi:hypothetical protein
MAITMAMAMATKMQMRVMDLDQLRRFPPRTGRSRWPWIRLTSTLRPSCSRHTYTTIPACVGLAQPAGALSNVCTRAPVCEQALDRIQELDEFGFFELPVDPNEYPEYRLRIKQPIDFTTIRGKLTRGDYAQAGAAPSQRLQQDVRLLCRNAIKFNDDQSPCWQTAKLIDQSLDGILSSFR